MSDPESNTLRQKKKHLRGVLDQLLDCVTQRPALQGGTGAENQGPVEAFAQFRGTREQSPCDTQTTDPRRL